jgi:2-C-methyl-D-erythritol 4-phosphate cytidylyltransferase
MIHSNEKSWCICGVIVAGGAGMRMGGDIPKQYLPLDDRDGAPILAWSVDAFNRNEVIDDIILVVPELDIKMVEQSIVDAYGFEKVSVVVPGGTSRQESTAVGIEAIGSTPDDTVVLVHDGVRPFVSDTAIMASATAAVEHGAALTARPVTDTIKQLDARGLIADTVHRDTLVAAQTPQAFHLELLRTAMNDARSEGFEGTDECMLVERLGITIQVVEGDADNLKITTQQDMTIAREIARRRESPVQAKGYVRQEDV